MSSEGYPSINLLRRIPGWVLLAMITAIPAAGQPGWFMAAAKDSAGFLEHKSASSVLLFEAREVLIDDDGHAQTHVRVARKILSTSREAEREGAMVETETEQMKVRSIRGWRIGRSGVPEELREDFVYRMGGTGLESIFSHSAAVVASFPGPAYGDIVGYEYDIENDEPYATYQQQVFQDQGPVRRSTFTLSVPEGWEVRQFGWEMGPVGYERQGTTHVWTANDLPYRAEEPMMPPWSFLRRELKVTISPGPGERGPEHAPSSWETVGARATEMNDPALERSPDLIALADSLAAGTHSTLERVAAVAAWVQSRIRYVGVEVGPGRWVPHKASAVLANGYGDCKDKVVVFRSLLGSMGIPSRAVLANTSSYVDTAVPTLFQFNHVIAAIPDSLARDETSLESVTSEGWVFFDPTDPAQPLGMLPPRLMGSRALVLLGDSGRLVRIPFLEAGTYRILQRAEISLSSPDTLRARVRICDIGPIAHYRKYAAETFPLKDRIEAVRREYSGRFRSFEVDDFATSSSGDSSWTEFVLTVPGGIRPAGSKFFVKPNLFPLDHILRLNAATRTYPVWFGPPMTVETEISIDPGKDWFVEPRAIAAADSCGESVALEYRVANDGRRAVFTSRFTSNGYIVGVDGYAAAKNFTSTVARLNDLSVAIRETHK